MNNKIIRKSIMFCKDMVLPKPKSSNESNVRLAADIRLGKPLMVARFGAVEIKMVLYGICPLFDFALKRYVSSHAGTNAGFFPLTREALQRFARLMCEDMKMVDVLASWRPEEIFFRGLLKNSWRMRLGDLGPVDSPLSYTAALEGKRVLVIHPFAETIEEQYKKNRHKIFKNKEVLPEFKSLQTIKAVQTIANNNSGFDTWFDALEYMKRQIDRCDFDVALIGCGAYGFPLAAYCKRIGKQAIHIGGSLQLFFGIKGKRWDNHGFYNDAWTRPKDSEKPKDVQKVENACYW